MILKFVIIGIGMVIGDVFMKSWSNLNYSLQGVSLLMYGLALAAYASSLTYYAQQLQTTNFSIATTLPIIINIVIVALLTVFYYKEQLSLNGMIGTVLAITSILFFYFA